MLMTQIKYCTLISQSNTHIVEHLHIYTPIWHLDNSTCVYTCMCAVVSPSSKEIVKC